VQAAAGNPQASEKAHAILIGESGASGRGALQRPSMGQDMVKGRRTEIEEINGFIVRKSEAMVAGQLYSLGQRSPLVLLDDR